MRCVAGHVRFLVSDNLDAFLLRAGPQRTYPGSPQVRRVFHFAVLHRKRGDTNAKFSGVGNGELHLALAIGAGLALRCRNDFARTLLPVPAAQLSAEGGGDGLLVVVLRGDVDDRSSALGVHVRIRLRSEIEAAVGRQREAVARDFAIPLVGDARLNAIDHVLLLRVDLGRDRDLQLAIGVERAALLSLLLAAVRVLCARPFVRPP